MSIRAGTCAVMRCRHPDTVQLSTIDITVCRCHAEQLGQVYCLAGTDDWQCEVDVDNAAGWRLVMRLVDPDVAVLYPPGVEGEPS